MSHAGESNYKCINSQSWSAMSLFLQYLKQTTFTHIQLEGKYFEDFTLFFNDDHKIICESKDRKKAFNYADLKTLLDVIFKRTTLDENDEILVICTNLNPKLKSYVEWMKYIDDPKHEIYKFFKKKKFSDDAISGLRKVRFCQVSPEKHHLAVYSIFS